LSQFLTTGGAADPFLPHLKDAIRRADREKMGTHH
jgi:hypothetical protein